MPARKPVLPTTARPCKTCSRTEHRSTKRLLRNYCSVVTAPCRTTRTVFVTAPSHTNFAIASKTLQRERHQHDCILACLHLPPRQRAAAGFDATRGHLDSTAHRG